MREGNHEVPPPGWGSDTNEPLLQAVEGLPLGVLVVAQDGTIVAMNRQLEGQFGYSRDELIGQSVNLLLPDVLRPATAAALPDEPASPSGRRGARNLVARHRDGPEIRVEVGLSTLESERGHFTIASVTPRPADNGTTTLIEGRLAFERFLSELSREFINLPSDKVDHAIRAALRRIGETLDIDRCTFSRLLADGALTDVFTWEAPGLVPAPAAASAQTQFPWTFETVARGEMVCFSTLDEVPNPLDRTSYQAAGILSNVTMPLFLDAALVGTVCFSMVRAERVWDAEVVHRLRTISTAFSNVLARRQSDEALQAALAEVSRLRDRLHVENVYLRTEARERLGAGPVVGESAAVREVLEQIRQVAATDSTVLLLGETGTGKELFATQLHELSARRTRTMVRVNCAAIPATLMESELFGREKGAYTDAYARQVGRFELADHSTIFLDEIGELTPEVQVKLLRVLEERQIERLGSPKSIRVDTRVVAATHRNLEQRIAEGTFREDLFYRLNVFPIRVPPLRERTEDIPLLIWRFVSEFGKAFGKRIDTITRENLAALQRYAWPGNIRELRNIVERAMIVATGPRLTIPVPTSSASVSGRHSEKLTDVERLHIQSVLETTRWRVRGAGGAADRLGLPPTTLETRMAKLGLTRPKSM